MSEEVYLGDGLYASDDGEQIKLRAPRGEGDHEVYLGPNEFGALCHYVEKFAAVRVVIYPASKFPPIPADEAKKAQDEA